MKNADSYLFELNLVQLSLHQIDRIAANLNSLGHSLVLWNPFASLVQGLILLLINSLLTLDGHSSSLVEGHTENVIGLDSAADSTVTWDWIAKVSRFAVVACNCFSWVRNLLSGLDWFDDGSLGL